MALGTPVIATDIQVLREVLGDAAMFVPTRAPERIAAAVHGLLVEEVRAEWSARGPEHAARFNWQRSAEATADVYRELV